MVKSLRPINEKKPYTIVVRITEKQNQLLIDYCLKNNCNTTTAITKLIDSLEK